MVPQARKWGMGSKPDNGKLDFTEGEAPRVVPVDAGAALSGPSRMEAEDSDSEEVVEEVRAGAAAGLRWSSSARAAAREEQRQQGRGASSTRHCLLKERHQQQDG